MIFNPTLYIVISVVIVILLIYSMSDKYGFLDFFIIGLGCAASAFLAVFMYDNAVSPYVVRQYNYGYY